jgi:hypothetical protein
VTVGRLHVEAGQVDHLDHRLQEVTSQVQISTLVMVATSFRPGIDWE